ncbi:DotU family type IV/VI secretion system protein [Rahnella woolbedingensis]|uniref:DotU family type IV/VI secretion system protein n=1 Tax=Rahnella woolbedingensis TaxID=1510574 RepID=A0A419N2Y6_9GAMM|nr:DotU family type IV/VI secretion system protein [Rahnella woolbedingensis]RJT36260.1 DotU family type IV/VI secretion system protein [Rahnella woolbedingensis]
MMRLIDCYLPVFKLVADFTHHQEDFENYDDFRQKCIVCLQQARHEAEHKDISDYEREMAFLATVVWLDETILCSTKQYRQRWRLDLLQRSYFQTSVGGELFFTHLNELKEEHQQARQVFLFCLQSGFHGKYSTQQDRPALAQLIEQQRRLCLPENWQTWPNNAEITPVYITKRLLNVSVKSRFCLALFGIASLYGSLLFLQAFYFL